MKFKSDMGVEFDDEILAASLLNSQIARRRIKDLHAFVATLPDSRQEYVVFNLKKSKPLKASTSLEAISVWLDAFYFVESQP